ncbi:MAG: ferritin-like domain-containing protein [Pseudomonadota bacterium]|jgi:ferritin-like metal-binding protein YciE
MTYQTLQSLLDQQLQEIYATEAHVARELSHYIDGVVSTEFKSQLAKHGEETQQRLEKISNLLQKLNIDPHHAKCRFMDALIKKGSEIVERRGKDALLDLGLVLNMRTIETIAQRSYEDARTIAEALGEDEVVSILEENCREAAQQECSWTVLAEDMVDALIASAAKTKRSITGGVEGVQP